MRTCLYVILGALFFNNFFIASKEYLRASSSLQVKVLVSFTKLKFNFLNKILSKYWTNCNHNQTENALNTVDHVVRYVIIRVLTSAKTLLSH